ncbi:hypothetical protein HPB50_005580 [Hyalomma asiaticum]|uniref:Uncharacterized protein n=1 Tax=Hyalomma asiaticum TaxID=266040 RepID=A0ACB7TFC8_HYAAI|nr:hypothetical protein HPB50_005580 [Hyalomma asiaticum]
MCAAEHPKEGSITTLYATRIDITRPCVVLGTESWLDSDIADSEVFPKAYVCYRKDRNSHSEGVFILVDKNISSRETHVKCDQSESVWAQLRLKNGEVITVCPFVALLAAQRKHFRIYRTLSKQSTAIVCFRGETLNYPELSGHGYALNVREETRTLMQC